MVPLLPEGEDTPIRMLGMEVTHMGSGVGMIGVGGAAGAADGAILMAATLLFDAGGCLFDVGEGLCVKGEAAAFAAAGLWKADAIGLMDAAGGLAVNETAPGFVAVSPLSPGGGDEGVFLGVTLR